MNAPFPLHASSQASPAQPGSHMHEPSSGSQEPCRHSTHGNVQLCPAQPTLRALFTASASHLHTAPPALRISSARSAMCSTSLRTVRAASSWAYSNVATSASRPARMAEMSCSLVALSVPSLAGVTNGQRKLLKCPSAHRCTPFASQPHGTPARRMQRYSASFHGKSTTYCSYTAPIASLPTIPSSGMSARGACSAVVRVAPSAVIHSYVSCSAARSEGRGSGGTHSAYSASQFGHSYSQPEPTKPTSQAHTARSSPDVVVLSKEHSPRACFGHGHCRSQREPIHCASHTHVASLPFIAQRECA
mmetsp:Transcript_18971/g.59037  ORF Transcript_18971/g.59037 Transcript_18971/m.59037 type:complete len:304 (-) Transcript_18971:866-1777(-)